jgi:hypothetical protein
MTTTEGLGGVSGFSASLALWLWVTAVVLYGLWRAQWHPGPDPVRRPGPER